VPRTANSDLQLFGSHGSCTQLVQSLVVNVLSQARLFASLRHWDLLFAAAKHVKEGLVVVCDRDVGRAFCHS